MDYFKISRHEMFLIRPSHVRILTKFESDFICSRLSFMIVNNNSNKAIYIDGGIAGNFFKIDDDWFIFSSVTRQLYYKCDQLYGVEQFIENVIIKILKNG